jgi:PhnB protein
MAKAKSAVPEGYHTLTPQLMLDNAAQTIDWYKKALGVEELNRFVGPDGKIMHAELKIGNSRFMVGEVMSGQKGPKAFGGSPASLWVYVENSDHAGAFTDPAGYVWWVATHVEELSKDELHRRAEDFFKQVPQHATH